MVAIFADLLGQDRVGADDGFFELGGNSLLATRVVARINAEHGIAIDMRNFFDAPTAAELAVFIDEAKISEDRKAHVPLIPRERPELVPLSLAQQRMWFLNRFEPEIGSRPYSGRAAAQRSARCRCVARRTRGFDRAARDPSDCVPGGRRRRISAPGRHCSRGTEPDSHTGGRVGDRRAR